jgi:CheY-like chemotaxis protein
MRTIRDMIDTYLKRQGFSVTQCSTAGDFYKSLHGAAPDVILLDVEMPDENGYQICDWLRNALGYSDIPELFVTAGTSKSHMEKAKAVGGDYFVKKPFDEASLIKGVERAIQIRAAKKKDPSSATRDIRKTAIVVDDMKSMRDLTESMLRGSGYAVMKCESAEQVYRMLKNVTPSVILLDVNMPGEDGYEICARIRQEMPHVDCPIVFVTSNKSKRDIELAKASGGDYFVVKPFDETSLMNGVRRAYQNRRAARYA